MYPVSNAFLTAVKANTRKYYWTGRITTKGGAVYEFDQDDMVKGSGYITSQCCGSTEIELGTVYAAEMGISLFSDIDRYILEDAIVTLSYHLQVAGGSYEEVPMTIMCCILRHKWDIIKKDGGNMAIRSANVLLRLGCLQESKLLIPWPMKSLMR